MELLKGNIILNYVNLNSKKISFIADANKKKIWKIYTWYKYKDYF